MQRAHMQGMHWIQVLWQCVGSNWIYAARTGLLMERVPGFYLSPQSFRKLQRKPVSARLP